MGCVLYEMMFFTFAFPNGLNNNPAIPDLGNSANYTPILKKSFFLFTNFSFKTVFKLNNFYSLKRMLIKDAAQRSSSKDICNEFTVILNIYFSIFYKNYN